MFRERLVQPVPVLNYSDLVPAMQTNVPGLVLANTTQIINSNLNNNAMVKIANRAVDLVVSQYSRQQSESRTSSAEIKERHVQNLVPISPGAATRTAGNN